jgi:anti-sigma factor RsiW
MSDSPSFSAPPPSPPPVSEIELHAYADRQLTAERAAEVEAWLAGRPDEAARVRAWADQKHALRGLFDPVLEESVPSALARAARRRPSWPHWRLAAGVALTVVAGGSGWMLRGAQDARATLSAASRPDDTVVGAAFAHRAAIAHTVYAPEVKRPVEVDADHEDQLVTWLSKRMGAAVKAPHLQGVGYSLEGGRLLPGERGPVAQFMYRDQAGHRLTLYVSNGDATPATMTPSTSAATTGFRYLREGQVSTFTWVDGAFRYAITAASDRPTLERVSEEVWRQLAAVKS